MHLEHFDVPIGPEPGGRLFDQRREQIDAERGVGGLQHRDLAGSVVDGGVVRSIEAGGADDDRRPGRAGRRQVRGQRGGRREIDQHVARRGQRAGIVANVGTTREVGTAREVGLPRLRWRRSTRCPCAPCCRKCRSASCYRLATPGGLRQAERQPSRSIIAIAAAGLRTFAPLMKNTNASPFAPQLRAWSVQRSSAAAS